ncbi:hypothetical protein D9757_013273 [Collybiopsis confluens]|uniref:Uncharacterized protein n=1 Tax=Collybiopsis confluens TaxID=2823264 RepID=A0A8H5D3N8_9AGAR|nr:hypothetical protein D9757_013273 [Collybiopsis confluens]
MHITSAYLLACLFAVGYAFPVENKHSIRAPPKGSSASPVIQVRFTSKTTTDAHALEALNAEVYVRQLLGRQSIKNALAHGSDKIEFTNHNGESEEAYFEVTGPAKCAKTPCKGKLDMKAPNRVDLSWLFITPENNPLSQYLVE